MTARLFHTCTGHNAALYALAQGANANQLLSAGGDGWIVAWDLDNPDQGKLLASVETQVFALANAPNFGWIAAGNMNGGVHWIDPVNPENTRNIQHHKKGVYGILFLENFGFSIGGDGMLTRWDAEKAQTLESFHLSAKALRCLDYSPIRRELAIGSSDNQIYLLDADTLALRQTLPAAHQNSVFSICYSPDGRYLLSGGRDALLNVWDIENDLSLVSAQAAHLYTINHIAFSPNGALFATASRDRTVKIWDANNFQLKKVIDTVRHIGHINSVNRLLWAPESTLASASDDRTLKLWKFENED
ncbi:MAG: WD40 repeat domain-containing protein [Lewinellaceae bacterium]|nr:WD40 repeat domain-containing protein [Lewinellaceae bacterium]